MNGSDPELDWKWARCGIQGIYKYKALMPCNFLYYIFILSIVFADRVPAGKLLQAAKELGVREQLLWIGSDAWASRESVVEDREEFVQGAIAIQPLRRKLKNYDKYFK